LQGIVYISGSDPAYIGYLLPSSGSHLPENMEEGHIAKHHPY